MTIKTSLPRLIQMASCEFETAAQSFHTTVTTCRNAYTMKSRGGDKVRMLGIIVKDRCSGISR